jgi:hypothetical protein
MLMEMDIINIIYIVTGVWFTGLFMYYGVPFFIRMFSKKRRTIKKIEAFIKIHSQN